ncbi:peroxisome biogenesis protein 5-like [Olea europaea var. sylvestris]|uniref:peroxisome biogenesis protein 5-like n=1 Tax=Olea europaea var. sylvestris TaxID=158386 RepID=UPI000C1CFFB4|nr:peroxisome biogenesis protein 5-like [Olea europaea var. sylvestris]
MSNQIFAHWKLPLLFLTLYFDITIFLQLSQEQSQLALIDQMRRANISSLAAMEHTRKLAHTLTQNNDPKFQNSKFHQFVSKMSRGEITIEDNQIKQGTFSAPGDWAAEYQQQYNGGQTWADQFVNEQASTVLINGTRPSAYLLYYIALIWYEF